MITASWTSFSIEDIVVPEFEFNLGAIIYLGLPIDIDLERVKDVFIDKIEVGKKRASVRIIKNQPLPTGATNPVQLCEALGLRPEQAINTLSNVGVSTDQPLGSLGFSQLKMIHIAASMQLDIQVIIYDTCGSDSSWAKRIDNYVESVSANTYRAAIKLVYPTVSKQRIEFQTPTNAPFVVACSEERLLRAAKGSTVEDMLDSIRGG